MIASISAHDGDAVAVKVFKEPTRFVSVSVGTGHLVITIAQAHRIRDELAAALRQPLELEEVGR
ncbi:MAG: hypothetical protein KJS95_11250 [Gammaproteobacteria bacterium]|nr:hypothetical protein [Gammaproteobacteria bacterium]